MNYVCADCGHEQPTMDRCKGCGSVRVVLKSVVANLLGPNWRKAFATGEGGLTAEDLPAGKMFDHAGVIVDRPDETCRTMQLVFEWAECHILHGQETGRPMYVRELMDARRVGVADVAGVRVVEGFIPDPPGDLGRMFADHLDLSRAAGLTLGHVIFVRAGHYSRRLMSHELRHVQQVEAAGGHRPFLLRYADELLRHGYAAAPLELDAVAHEQG